MDLKQEIAQIVEVIKTASVEEGSIQEKQMVYYARCLQVPNSLLRQLKGLNTVVEDCHHLDEVRSQRIEKTKTTTPFFDRLREAGLLEGNVWKGTPLQAGFAAYLFTIAFENEGHHDKKGSQHDKYYQAIAQFSKFDRINKETLKRNIVHARDHFEKDRTEAAARYGYQHEDEIEAVKNAFK